MKMKLLMALRPFPLILIVFPPGCAKLRRTRSAARTHVNCVRERPASPPALAGEGGEPSSLTRDIIHSGIAA